MNVLNSMNDDQLVRLGAEELVRLLRKAESEKMHIMVDHGTRMKEVNKRMQVHLLEIRSLKEVNQRLQDDNQELRDLCCFLDDDRQKNRKMAREWQRFGRYTSSVMRSEVTSYQNKLTELETRQHELLRENLELKELCLFLDQERYGHSSATVAGTGDRDQGDGSSNSSPMEDKQSHPTSHQQQQQQQHTEPTNSQLPTRHLYASHDNTLQYVRHLEANISQLEDEKKALAQRVERNEAEGQGQAEGHFFPKLPGYSTSPRGKHNVPYDPNQVDMGSIPAKPEAVVHAMKVLELHDQLDEIDNVDSELNDSEKAIVRAMCNVVWKKLGDETPGLPLPRS